MLKEAIYHRPKNQFAYVMNENALHIQLRTKRNDINEVFLVYGDQFEFENNRWKHSSIEMKVSGSDELFDYWLVEVIPRQRRMRYAFHLKSGNQELFYTEKGFSESFHNDFSAYFCFPFHHPSERFAAPSWVKETIWYQIFPDRFANGNPKNDPDGTLPWNSTDPTTESIFGGDFEGVIQHLDYLVKLGITGIYFTPIFKAHSNHKYDTIDYMQIDPQFGDKDDFKRLVNECHKRGIKVMLDAVFNHCGSDFPPFQDVKKNLENSRYKEWFHITSYDNKNLQYHTFAFEKSIPKLNTQNPEVKKYLLEVGQYWVKEFQIDGWRLDVANEIDHQFWRDFHNEVEEINEHFYLIGSLINDHEKAKLSYLDAGFDSLLNNRFYEEASNKFTNTDQSLVSITKIVEESPMSLSTFIDSANTVRFTKKATENQQHPGIRLKIALSYMYTVPGIPFVYYGTEIALNGGPPPENSPLMNFHTDDELINYIGKLAIIRKSFPALTKGEYKVLYEKDGMIIFKRTYQDETNIVAINNTSVSQKVLIPAEDIAENKELRGLVNGDIFQEANGEYEFILDRELAEIYEMKEKTGLNFPFISVFILVPLLFILFLILAKRRGKRKEKS